MNETTAIQFNNIGYMTHRFEEEQLSFLREEVNDIKTDFSAYKSSAFNKKLAGNIQYEYFLPKSVPKLHDLLLPYLKAYNEQFAYMKSISFMTHSVPIIMNSAWVNFQKKTEFNPVHTHDGIVSFVIYLDIPYSIEDEQSVTSSINSNVNIPAHFCLYYINSMGQIQPETIPVDRKYRNVLLMFPSKMAHCVYPFYTSDDYRISVSGNFSLNTVNSVL